MFRRVIFATVFFLTLIVSAQSASACQFCKYGGFVCNANGCEPVEYCATPSFPKRGYPDCYFILSTCVTGGDLCVWASLIETARPEQPQDETAS